MTEQTTSNTYSSTHKSERKTGRTLLVIPSYNSSIDETLVSSLTGVESSFTTKSNSLFITFDSIENSLSAFNKIRQDYKHLKVKFSYYKLYFKVNGLTDSTDYSTAKNLLISHLEKEANCNVVYFKFYLGKTGNKFIGCGDFTVDTKESMDKLISKDSPLKNFVLEDLSGTFYRYNKLPNVNHDNEHKETKE